MKLIKCGDPNCPCREWASPGWSEGWDLPEPGRDGGASMLALVLVLGIGAAIGAAIVGACWGVWG